MKSKQQIQYEIKALKAIKPNVRMTSAFGDNHHDAIDAQITVLEDGLEDGQIYDKFEPFDEETDADEGRAENVLDAAMQAFRWRSGESDEVPSEDWKSLA